MERKSLLKKQSFFFQHAFNKGCPVLEKETLFTERV